MHSLDLIYYCKNFVHRKSVHLLLENIHNFFIWHLWSDLLQRVLETAHERSFLIRDRKNGSNKPVNINPNVLTIIYQF